MKNKPAFNGIEPTPLLCSGLSSFDYSRLVEWMNDPNRKPANIAFTAGCARDAARAFEEHRRHTTVCIMKNSQSIGTSG